MRKFEIPRIPQTCQKAIRFPIDTIEAVEEEIKETNCTFSAFVVAAVKIALEDLKEKSGKNREK